MRTDRDFAKHCAIFVGELAIGALLFVLLSCALTPAQQDRIEYAAYSTGATVAKTAAPFLPPPLDLIATGIGTWLLERARATVMRKVRKRRRTKKKALASPH